MINVKNDVLLEVSKLTLRRAGTEILREADLLVRRGEIHVLLGLNGAGKTSVALTLMGASGYRPEAGRIVFDGHDITHASITERARLGMTMAWQEPARFEGLTVADYLALGMDKPSRERVEQAMDLVALSPVAYLGRTVSKELSGGERKRIELAAVYAMHPKLAILDEPDSGIDVLSLSEIVRLIRRMASEGTAVLLITHRDELVAVADSASLICAGEIVRRGDPSELSDYYVRRCRPHGQALGSQPWPFDVVECDEQVTAEGVRQ